MKMKHFQCNSFCSLFLCFKAGLCDFYEGSNLNDQECKDMDAISK